jgi:hypothetical protein
LERDFTLEVYKKLLQAIGDTGREVLPLKEYLSRKAAKTAFFILRHDVDRRPRHALEMARAEQELGLCSTYYFRMRRGVFKADIIKEIARLGHEVGYHYEVLDKARGSMRVAERIFREELERFRELTEIRTACMHGNPLTPWDNRDFWKGHALSSFDLLGEAYLSVTDRDLFYVTDTGRGYDRERFNLQDGFPEKGPKPLLSISGTADLIGAIREKRVEKLYIQIHPNRWSWKMGQWYRQLGEDMVLNSLKLMMRFLRRRGGA